MDGKKLIPVNVTHNRKEYSQVNIPANINEVELKALLRDLGHISSYRRSYLTTKVYLEDDTKTNLKEICTGEYRSLEDLGIVENSLIVIKEGEPEPVPEYDYIDHMSMRCLYGCPMAHSVEEAMNQAEKYSEDDSLVTTGSIYELDWLTERRAYGQLLKQ